MLAFITDAEFKQAAFDIVAQIVAGEASTTIASGNIADMGQTTLEYLERTASNNNLKIATISLYTDIITEQNQLMFIDLD